MRYLLLILCFVILKFGFTQTVLLEEKVDSVYPTSKFGINSKHFFHSYVGYAFVFDKNSSSIEKTKFWGTQNFSLGLRYKRRLLNHLATGLEAEIRYSSFNVPIEKPILKKQYQTWDLKLAWYYRVNFGMRGAIMGKFLDIGLYGSRFLNARRYTKYDVNQ